ncbi:hypothetical protein L2E82_46877 [Cichorium intybus]|uniref:Uncharacterized protein n=1 Tax=Cichorium intybus TaxID=13427 RepID=A0ACB8YUZ1_CICIN|nr:hypothetical protein L2E82_46877 [Cichorium intybus]
MPIRMLGKVANAKAKTVVASDGPTYYFAHFHRIDTTSFATPQIHRCVIGPPSKSRFHFATQISKFTSTLLNSSPSPKTLTKHRVSYTQTNLFVMSNNQRYNSRSLPNKTQQQRFVPKAAASQTLNSRPTLSDSLRQQQQQSSSSGTSKSSSGQRRIQAGGGSGKFISYLPQDEAVAAGLGADEGGLDPVESQGVVDLLNRECSLLLKLNPKDFWREVASDTSLHAFLESFLKFRSRWYDFPYRGAKGIVAGVIVGEHELSRRVFMILYRISSNRDPGAKASDSLSAKDHAVILQEKKLLDLPKLLDICAIYGHENEELTRLIVTNAIKAQPLIHDSFNTVISHFLNIVHTMYERCSTSLEVLLSSHSTQDEGPTRLHSDYLEVMDFINDAIVSMDVLVTAYKHAAVYFSCPVETSYGSDELLKVLARLHDSLLPSLHRGFQMIFSSKRNGNETTSSDMLPKVVISLKMLSSRIADFCWKLVNLCYLSEELFGENMPHPSASKIFPAQVEDPVIRADILVQTFREIIEECSIVQEERSLNSLLQSVEKKYQLMGRLQILCNEGWISIDNEQFQFLSGIISVPTTTEIPKLPSPTNTTIEMDEDNAIIESKISQIKDLFPDYGKGFISACLEVYNQNPEEVIQRILEGTLHSDLLSLDTSLPIPLPPPNPTPPPIPHKDKGKGKLIDLTTPTPTPLSTKLVGPSPSSTSSSSIGRFVRKSTTNVSGSGILDVKDETSKNFALQSVLEYEDEYDDSFDDLGLSVVDSGLDDLSEKVNSRENSAPEASRWGSRQKPQFYVKDGKNYSYKVSGSVAAANYNEANIVNQAQKEMIHGLGRGGNLPLGAVQKVVEMNEVVGGGRGGGKGNDRNAPVKTSDGEERKVGRGRGWGRGNIVKEENVGEVNGEEGGNEGGGERGRGRGRGRRGGGGGRSNHYRKDQAMKKHFSGLGGF